MKNFIVLARVLYALPFLLLGSMHFSSAMIGYAESAGVPMAQVLVPGAGLLAIAGALSILLGYRAKYGAWLLVAFLVPVTFKMHAFWGIEDPMMMQMQMVMFLKNCGLIGGALLVTQLGSGPASLRP